MEEFSATPYFDSLFVNWDTQLPPGLDVVSRGNPEEICEWLRKVDSVRLVDSRGWNAVHVAARTSAAALHAVIEGLRDREDADLPSQLNALTHTGVSALHMACEEKCLECAKVLLAAGAVPNLGLDSPAQENELSLLFTHCLEEISSRSRLPQDALSLLELLREGGAHPDSPEVRMFVTPLCVLMREAGHLRLLGNPLAVDLTREVLRLWPDMVLWAADSTPNCFLLQCCLDGVWAEMTEMIWNHFEARGLITWEILKDVEGSEDLLDLAVQSGSCEGVMKLLNLGFDPLLWSNLSEVVNSARNPTAASGRPDRVESSGVEPAAAQERPFYRADSSSVCPLLNAMTQDRREIVRRMLTQWPSVFVDQWQEFIECCRVSGAFVWLLWAVKRQGPAWQAPALPPAHRHRMPDDLELPDGLDLECLPFAAEPTIMDWAMGSWIRQVDGRFPLSADEAKVYFQPLLASRGALDPRPSPCLFAALRLCPREDAAQWTFLLEERAVVHSIRDNGAVADAIFRVTLPTKVLWRRAVALGARPRPDDQLLPALRSSFKASVSWAVSAILLSAAGSSPRCLSARSPLSLEALSIAACRRQLALAGHLTEEAIRTTMTQWLPRKIVRLMVFADRTLNLLSKMASEAGPLSEEDVP